MTVSEQHGGTWKPVPGAAGYEACDTGGLIRSVDRTISGRFYPGRVLTPKRTGTSAYWQVKYTDDTGRQRTRPVHVLVLEAHVGLCPEGMQACHWDDDNDYNDLSNLRWDTDEANREDRQENHPPKLKPLKPCVVCGGEFAGNGRRCHPCVVKIAKEAARLLRRGVRLKAAAEQLVYPVSADGVDGIHALARRYGGYGLSPSRRVRAWLAALVQPGDAQ